MKKIFFLTAVTIALVLAVTPVMAAKPDDTGFNEFGYNYQARIFNGTSYDWCHARGWTDDACVAYFGEYVNDKLVMKWNAEWDRGNDENWENPPYDAWEDNEWNGRIPDGSGEIWHYKIAWDQGCVDNGIPSTESIKGEASCLWGPFAMIQSQGSGADRLHVWDVLMKPAGYGAY